jgi:hypothetical protein
MIAKEVEKVCLVVFELIVKLCCCDDLFEEASSTLYTQCWLRINPRPSKSNDPPSTLVSFLQWQIPSPLPIIDGDEHRHRLVAQASNIMGW